MPRRTIIASYWLVVFLALPLWWYTTSIVRLALPTARVTFHAQNSLRLPVRLHFENSPVDLQPLLDAKGLHVNLDTDISDATYTVRDHPQTSISGRILRCPPSNAAHILASLLAPSSSSTDSEQRVVQYSPRYRLAFSLLNEDAAAGGPILGWEITNAIQRYLSPILDQLSPLHNFTIESQVQFHAPLAFKPSETPDGTFGLTQEQLTVFVNSAEWSLSSSASNDPVLHFVLFVPSLNQSPLRILNPDSTPSSSNAFLLPQWGTILLYNAEHRNTKLSLSDLEPVFKSFAAQLLTLLGAPRLPPNVARSPTETAILTDWQLDALMRRRALENAERAKDTLHSIVKLVDEIQNMPVGKDVRNDVVNALNELDEMYALSNVSLKDTLRHSAQALALASRAFFNPGMLPLLYFPAEHKYAVYTPLFASAMIPMVVTALREFKAWRRERRAQS